MLYSGRTNNLSITRLKREYIQQNILFSYADPSSHLLYTYECSVDYFVFFIITTVKTRDGMKQISRSESEIESEVGWISISTPLKMAPSTTSKDRRTGTKLRIHLGILSHIRKIFCVLSSMSFTSFTFLHKLVYHTYGFFEKLSKSRVDWISSSTYKSSKKDTYTSCKLLFTAL